MIELARFKAGLHALCVAFNREPSADLAQVYYGAIGGKLTLAQWEAAVRRAVEEETFFPPVKVLLRYGLAGTASPAALAGGAYDAILSAFEAGRTLSPPAVEEQYGLAARDAFMAAGGARAFEWCEPRDEPFRRKRFSEAFVEQAERSPALALPGGGDERHGELSRAEARELVSGIRDVSTSIAKKNDGR